jgi:hypothetical protein
LSLAELVLALPPALSPIELDLLLLVVLRLLALRLLAVRLSCPLSLPSLSPVCLKGEIDTRLLTKVGRAKIKEDLKLSQLLTQALLE